MKVTVEFLSLPNVVKMIGSKAITMDFSGQSVDDLVEEVAKRHGAELGRFLLDETGRLDPTFAVTINKQEWIRRDQMNRFLREGDVVTIMMLTGGG